MKLRCKACGDELESDEPESVSAWEEEEDDGQHVFGLRPARRPSNRPLATPENVRGRLMVPAVIQMILAAISFVLVAAGFFAIVQGGLGPPQGHPQANDPGFREGFIAGQLAVPTFGLLSAAFVMVGCLCMIMVKMRGLAVAAAIVAMIPCLSPLIVLGIPFGIWSLVVLNNSEVREAFESR
jgi:hypothetical protein